MRKALEKHGWNQDLGMSMLESYERVLPWKEGADLPLLPFLYPEKYWKQLNFYNNTNKAWIPGRNTEIKEPGAAAAGQAQVPCEAGKGLRHLKHFA
ncbi:MAG: hypothetical protein ACLTL5_10780 [Oscillospiraceae bacterium]